MTRLKEGDIQDIRGGLKGYDVRLKRMTGATLRQIACHAAGVDEAQILDLLPGIRIAAVPVTSGLGVIDGFSDTVAAIVSHLGFDAFVTESSDAAGIAEGFEKGGDILFLADDDKFVAITEGWKEVVDNAQATAQGFVSALESMRGGLEGEWVLVLGCGPLGVAATRALLHRGASVAICDTRPKRALDALEEIGRDAPDRIRMEDNPHTALNRYELIFDATNVGGFIGPADLTPHTLVAAPGMPCALSPEAMAKYKHRVLHDVLELGTATMALQAARDLPKGPEAGKGNEE